VAELDPVADPMVDRDCPFHSRPNFGFASFKLSEISRLFQKQQLAKNKHTKIKLLRNQHEPACLFSRGSPSAMER